MARLYADENFPLPVVEELRRLGHDVRTIAEAGKAGQKVPDEVVLADARADRRAVLTHNRRDFIRLHSSQPSHAGVVVCTPDPNFASLARRIHTAIEGQPELSAQLIRVNRPSVNLEAGKPSKVGEAKAKLQEKKERKPEPPSKGQMPYPQPPRK